MLAIKREGKGAPTRYIYVHLGTYQAKSSTA